LIDANDGMTIEFCSVDQFGRWYDGLFCRLDDERSGSWFESAATDGSGSMPGCLRP
jgi:hypothetical protein